MHVQKAFAELHKLTSAPANLDTLVRACFLIQGLERENRDVSEGERPNETVNSKLRSARNWFEILCGIGEDGNWEEEHLRSIIRQQLSGAAMHVTQDGMDFNHWEAVNES